MNEKQRIQIKPKYVTYCGPIIVQYNTMIPANS